MTNLLDAVRIEYPLSPEYGKNWSEEMALRELIANEIDAVGDKFTMLLDASGMFTLTDEGGGLLPRHLVMGVSEKSGPNAIGQFGEGLKMAALVYAGRKQTPVYIQARDREMWFTCEESETFGTPVLVLTWRPLVTPVTGTMIAIQGVDVAALDAAKSRFLVFQPDTGWLDKPLGIRAEPGVIYVAGVRVQTYDRALFGYALADSRLMNRDRTTLDYERVVRAISIQLGKCCQKTVVDAVLIGCMKKQILETEEPVQFFSDDVHEFWKSRVRVAWGKKVALVSGSEHDLVAKDRGYRLVSASSSSAMETLIGLGVLPSTQVVRIKPKKQKVEKIKKADLPTTLRKKWSAANRYAKKACRRIYGSLAVQWPPSKVVKTFDVEVTDAAVGLWDGKKIQVLLRHAESASLEILIGTLLHEYAHKVSHAYDRTREFESELTQMVGVLATPKKLRVQKTERQKPLKIAASTGGT